MLIIIIYSFMFLITYPFLLMDVKQYCEEENVFIYPRVLAIIVAAIPFYNLCGAYQPFINWVSFKLIHRRLRKTFKKYPGEASRKALNDIDRIFNKYNKIEL